MRGFNDIEKKVITALVEARSTKDILSLSAKNYILDSTDCYAIEWVTDVGYEKVEFYFMDKNAPMSVLFGALDILSLLKYLEDNGYILVTQIANASQQPKQLYCSKKHIYKDGAYWIKGDENGNEKIQGRQRILYTDAALLLDRYANAIIYPTTELELYVKRGFKTEDDVKFNKQRWISWIGIGIALFSSIFAIYQSTQPTKIDGNQLNQIEAIVKESKAEFPKTVDAQIVSDTLGVYAK